MDLRQLQPPRNAKSPMEHGPGARRCSEATRFEETRVERWCGQEGCHEFARFAAPLLLFLSTCLLRTPSPVKSSDSQRQGWRLTDEEIIAQVQ